MSTSPAAKEPLGSPGQSYDVDRVRTDFPALHQEVHGQPLVYLDNAATAHKPRQVIEALVRFYEHDNSNVHRGVHTLSERATRAYEQARATVQRFLGAGEKREVVFTRGATEAINLVAASYGRTQLKPGDEIVLTAMEHHSNIVPWQLLSEQSGARLRIAPVNDKGELLLDELAALIGPRTRLVAVVHVSNALGTVNPIKQIVGMAHDRGATVLVDGAQAVAHAKVDVVDLDCDFYALSGHKLYGPTGIGVLYGKAELLAAMPPWQGGGEMILSVTFEHTTYNEIPYKFEAGTPNIAGAVGLGAAIDYLDALGLDAIAQHERAVSDYAAAALESVPGLRPIGTAADKVGVHSFVIEGIHPHDIGTILDHEGIAVRTGHHCAQPLMQRFQVPATARASLGLYNTREEVDRLVAGLGEVVRIFG